MENSMSQCAILETINAVIPSKEQRQALSRIYQKVLSGSQARELFCADYARLRDSAPGPGLVSDSPEPELASDSAERKALFGEDAGLYPTLLLLARVPWLEAEYERLGIARQVLQDTLSDIPLWIDNAQRRTGRMAMREYRWLTNHLRMRLFRLGRLEYIYTTSRVPAYLFRHRDGSVAALMQAGMRFDERGDLSDSEDARETTFSMEGDVAAGHPVDALGRIGAEPHELSLAEWVLTHAPGDPVLDVHIPEGPPLSPEEIGRSLETAPRFYWERFGLRGMRAFTCGSWLMSPALSQIVPKSNIALFQQRFLRIPYTLRDDQVFERVYGGPLTRWEEMPMDSRLQQGVRDWYLSGGHCRQMQGVILLDGKEAAQ